MFLVTRDEICRGESMDSYSLLYLVVEKKDKEVPGDKDKERLKQRRLTGLGLIGFFGL